MPRQTLDEIRDSILKRARSSNQALWLYVPMHFYLSKSGWLFAWQEKLGVHLLAGDPLPPEKSASFAEALMEWMTAEKVSRAMAIGISESTANAFEEHENFVSVAVGEEPWLDLENCIPTGKSGKGVRAGRNQAIRAGLKVSTRAAEVSRNEIERLLERWKSRKAIRLEGFLQTVNPFALPGLRKIFFVHDRKNRARGFLVATPIGDEGRWFLEDQVMRYPPPRGASEFLALESMVELRNQGAKCVSLGIISMNQSASAKKTLPWLPRALFYGVPKFFSAFVTNSGLNIFRRRFKPNRWEKVFISLGKSGGPPTSRDWVTALLALFLAFEPRWKFSWTWLTYRMRSLAEKHSLALGFTAATALPFALVNHWGTLPAQVMENFSFQMSRPIPEWVLRSVASDFLHSGALHFWTCIPPLAFLLTWAERTRPRLRVLAWLALVSIFDDFIIYGFLIKPFDFFHPRIFQHMASHQEVGSSLFLFFLIGMQVFQLRRNHEIIFIGLLVASLLAGIWGAGAVMPMVFNLNHTLFLALGYAAGAYELERMRRESRKVARAKPPAGRSVRAKF